jgi:hypothetical protein
MALHFVGDLLVVHPSSIHDEFDGLPGSFYILPFDSDAELGEEEGYGMPLDVCPEKPPVVYVS